MKYKLVTVALITALSAGTVFAGAHLPYEQRQASMKTMSGSLRAIGGMAQGAVAFDGAVVATSLAAMQAAAETAQGMFPAEPDLSPDTHALAAIWENRADFDARLANLVETITVAAANPPADVAGLGALMGALGPQCQGCHQNYRMPLN